MEPSELSVAIALEEMSLTIMIPLTSMLAKAVAEEMVVAPLA